MGLAWASADILTPADFAIAITAELVGCIVLELLRILGQAIFDESH
jgi:hypothetical protein